MTRRIHSLLLQMCAADSLARIGSHRELASRIGCGQSSVSTWLKKPLQDRYKGHPIDEGVETKIALLWSMHYEGREEPAPLPEEEVRAKERSARKVGEDGTMQVSLVTAKQVKSLADLYDACEVDRNVWEVSTWEAGAWGSPVKTTRVEEDGTVVAEPVVVQLHRVSAKFRPKTFEPAIREVIGSLISELREATPQVNYRTDPSEGDHLLVLSLPDLHVGKWAPSEARAVLLDAVSTLLARARGFDVGRILISLAGDSLHIDGPKGQTTRGTQLEYVGHWKEHFAAFCGMAYEAAQMCAARCETVVAVEDGNHDGTLAFCASEVLRAMASGSERITVLPDEGPRRYYRYGATLLGFTHGDTAKAKDLPLLMATEAPAMWAETTSRVWFTGHLHHRAIDSDKGVSVRISPALCPADRWHRARGYVSPRGAEAVIYNHSAGRVGEFAYVPALD